MPAAPTPAPAATAPTRPAPPSPYYHPATGCTPAPATPRRASPRTSATATARPATTAAISVRRRASNLATEHYNETTHTAVGLEPPSRRGRHRERHLRRLPRPESGRRRARASPASTPTSRRPQVRPTAPPSPASSATTTRAPTATPRCSPAGRPTPARTATRSRARLRSTAATAPVVNTTSSAGCGASGTGCHSDLRRPRAAQERRRRLRDLGLPRLRRAGRQARAEDLRPGGRVPRRRRAPTTTPDRPTAHASQLRSRAASATGCHPASQEPLRRARAVRRAGQPVLRSTPRPASCATTTTNPTASTGPPRRPSASRCHDVYHGVPAGSTGTHDGRDDAHTPTSASDGCTRRAAIRDSLMTIHGADEVGASDCSDLPLDPRRDRLGHARSCHSAKDNWYQDRRLRELPQHDEPASPCDASHTASPASRRPTPSRARPTVRSTASDCHELAAPHDHPHGSVHDVPPDTDRHRGGDMEQVLRAGWLSHGWLRRRRCTPASTRATHRSPGQTCYAASCHPASARTVWPRPHKDARRTSAARPARAAGLPLERHAGSRECTSCHADKVDGLTDTTQRSTPRIPRARRWPALGRWRCSPTRSRPGSRSIRPDYDHGCATCHDTDLKTEHDKASSARSTPRRARIATRRSRLPEAGGLGQELQSGLAATGDGGHAVAGQEQHASTATLAKHAVAASYTAEPGGCSAAPWRGGGQLSAHDLPHDRHHPGAQPQDRRVAPAGNADIAREISVACDECHASAAFRALTGTWDGTCNACHDGTALETTPWRAPRATTRCVRYTKRRATTTPATTVVPARGWRAATPWTHTVR